MDESNESEHRLRVAVDHWNIPFRSGRDNAADAGLAMWLSFNPRTTHGQRSVSFAAPALSLVIGATAAWWVRSTSGASTTQATLSGAIAGLGAVAASVAAFAFYGWNFGNDPAIQEWIRNSEPYPEARVPYDWIARLSAVAGVLVGLAAGLINLALAAVGGLFVGLWAQHAGTHVPAHSVPR
jgi:hypothetical protein